MNRLRPAAKGIAGMVLDSDLHLPLYVQVKEQLRGRIVTGTLPQGGRLPPVRQLAATLGVNQNTALKALKDLQAEGYLTMRPGRGIYVTPQSEKGYGPEKQAELSRLVGEFVGTARSLGILTQDILSAVMSHCFHHDGTAPVLRGIFVECNQPTAQRYAADLQRHLDVQFEPVLLEDLQGNFEQFRAQVAAADLVVTTALHRPEVKAALDGRGEQPVNLYALSMGQMLDVAGHLAQLQPRKAVGLICMSPEDVRVMERSLRQNLPRSAGVLRKAAMTDEAAVATVLATVDALVLTSAVKEGLGSRLPPDLPLVEYHNRLDEAGVEMLRQVVENLRNATAPGRKLGGPAR